MARRSGAGGGGTTRRKHSLGNLRRAHPASGATWNVQVVRGKMSSKCLWHACRALILGLTLLLLGAGMATLGYYADHLSIGTEVRGNVTVRVKNELKGFHLNNFSYVGPIVMGFGGFIVVASCVMTFEARDSAAKVVPARLRSNTVASKNTSRSNQSSSGSQRRVLGMHGTRWDQHFGVFRSSPATEQPNQPAPTSSPVPFDRDALTAELIKFSKSLRATRESSGSVATCSLLQPPTAAVKNTSAAGNKLYWHAASFDESCRKQVLEAATQKDRMAERTRRSDTAKRHVLARQKPIEQEEENKGQASPLGNRRCSTLSDSSYSGRWTARCASIASRASSIDSRRIQVDLHSPEVMPKSILRSPKRYSSGVSATPSVEKEFRSQLSVCSEPPASIRQLSGQSSLEPCVPEEVIEIMETETLETFTTNTMNSTRNSINPVDPPPPAASPSFRSKQMQQYQNTARSRSPIGSRCSILKKPRPDSLPLIENSAILDFCKPHSHSRAAAAAAARTGNNMQLQRSNSSRTHDRPKVNSHYHNNSKDSIYFIRSDLQHGSEDFYDSEQVINERRTTLLKADSETALAERKLSSLSIPERILEQSQQQQHSTIEMDEKTIAKEECTERNEDSISDTTNHTVLEMDTNLEK